MSKYISPMAPYGLLDPLARPVSMAVITAAAKHPVEFELVGDPAGDSDVRMTTTPFQAGTSALWVNGVRYWPADDYEEIVDGLGVGFMLPGISDDDELVFKALEV